MKMWLKSFIWQPVLAPLMSWLGYTFIFRKQFYFVVSGLEIIGHGNTDSNLESPCILKFNSYSAESTLHFH
jgi:hypothetical protein